MFQKLTHVMLLSLLVLSSTSGCALRALYRDVGNTSFYHEGYTRVRVDSSSLFLELKASGQHGHAWTTIPLSSMASVERLPRYDLSVCDGRDFGYALFSPVEPGRLPGRILDHTQQVTVTMVSDEFDDCWNFKCIPLLVELQRARETKDLRNTSRSDTYVLSYKRYPFFLFAFSGNAPAEPGNIVLLSGPSADCSRNITRRESWSYPVIVLGTPFALAADVVLVPLAGLGAILHLIGISLM